MELTLREAAALMGISVRTLRARAARGDIPARKQGGVWTIMRRDLPLTEHQRSALQGRADEIRRAVEEALPSRLAGHAGDRRRTLADLDAFRRCVEVHARIRTAEPSPGRANATAALELTIEAIAEASLHYARPVKLEALDRARRSLARAIAQLFLESGLPPVEPALGWIRALEQEAAPAISGLARWASRLPGPRSEP